MSPSAAAPSSASQIACRSTSASECPASPLWNGTSTPPITRRRPGAKACTSRPWPILIGVASSAPPNAGFGDGEVLGKRDLQVRATAGDQARLETHALDRGRLVGDGAAGALQRLREQPGAEHLRRLREPELLAPLGARDALHAGLVLRRALHGVGRGLREDAADRVVLALADEAFQIAL